MSREIKFRAWDGDSLWEVGVLNQGEAFEDWREFEDGRNMSKNIMQFTGLKDKNGVDIYEGDIVIYTEFETISSENGNDYNEIPAHGVIVWNKSYARFEIKNSSEPYDCMDEDENLEVVGNVYENPELLEERKNG